jgi:hypothetical protein
MNCRWHSRFRQWRGQWGRVDVGFGAASRNAMDAEHKLRQRIGVLTIYSRPVSFLYGILFCESFGFTDQFLETERRLVSATRQLHGSNAALGLEGPSNGSVSLYNWFVFSSHLPSKQW